jgi:hypothetical protein
MQNKSARIDRPPSLFIGGLPFSLLYPSLAINYPALSDTKTPVIAADTSAFQEPNTNGYAVSKTPQALSDYVFLA